MACWSHAKVLFISKNDLDFTQSLMDGVIIDLDPFCLVSYCKLNGSNFKSKDLHSISAWRHNYKVWWLLPGWWILKELALHIFWITRWIWHILILVFSGLRSLYVWYFVKSWKEEIFMQHNSKSRYELYKIGTHYNKINLLLI